MVSRASLISRAFGKSGALASVAEASTPASNRKITADSMAEGATGSRTVTAFSELSSLTGMKAGDNVLVTNTDKLYIFDGVGWYIIATITNASPTAITGVNGAYSLSSDGTATTITAVSTDPEGFPLTWSYAVTTGSLGSTATVAQSDNVFTITPSTNSANAGTFSLTFSVTDGVNGLVSAVSSFALSFVVQNSRYTALSVKATAAGSNQTFDDASTSNYTITANGDVATSAFSPYRHGGYSLKFENSVADDNNIKFNNTTGSGAVAASGEFCVETWVKFTVNSPPSGSPNARIFASNGSGGNAANNLQLFPEYSGSYIGAVSIYTDGFVYQANATSEVINDDQWHHLAVTRDSSNNLRWFIDGTLITTIASNTTTFQFEETRLGKRDGGTGATSYTGEMRDTRVVIGSSVYESAFTPPALPLTAIANTYLLVGDLPYIKDESTNNFSIHAGTFTNGNNVRLPSKSPTSLFDNAEYSEASHGASAYFDGTGDYLSVSNFVELGTDSWTIEGWYKFDNIIYNTTISQGMFTFGRDNGSLAAMIYEVSGEYKVRVVDNGVAVLVESSTPIQLGKIWNHIAITFTDSDNTIRIFINGNLDTSTGTKSTAWTFTEKTFQLGARYYSGAVQIPMEGSIQDFSVTKGVVRYTANFTPPTSPVVADSDTKFLLNPETSISDLSQQHALTCYGNVATDTTTVKFAGTKSIAFNGTGDYIVFSNGTPSTTDLTFDEEFTIEFWAYLNATNVNIIFYSCGGGTANWSATTGNESSFFIYNNRLYHQSSQGSSFHSDYISIPSVVQTGEWQHWAVTCDANADCKWYLNGTLMWSYAHVFPTKKTGTIWRAVIGAGQYLSDDNLDGYIQDFRITKGLVRYTSNFTPPTTELQG